MKKFHKTVLPTPRLHLFHKVPFFGGEAFPSSKHIFLGVFKVAPNLNAHLLGINTLHLCHFFSSSNDGTYISGLNTVKWSEIVQQFRVFTVPT